MADSNRFPIYISTEYDGQDPFPALLRHVDNANKAIRSKFDSAFQDVEQIIAKALDKPLNARGALDLDAEKMRAAADGARRQAIALREVAEAADRIARSDPSVVLRRQAADAQNAATVAEQYSRSVAEQALALDKLQGELNQTRSATTGLASAQRGYTGSLAAQRGAMVGAGQQFQDLVISIGSGQRASTVLAQQLPQLAFALSGVGGTAGRVATLFAGPWGVALAAGSFALGPLIDGLFKTSEAADQVKFASDAVSEAQGILGGVLDLVTGKMNVQTESAIALARAQILVARVNAQTRAADARRGVRDIQYRETQFSGGLGGGFSARRRPIDARDVISKSVLAGTMDASTAVDRLENLRRVGQLTDDQFAAAAASVANLGVELENIKVFGEAEKLLNGTGGRGLLKPAKTKKGGGRKGDGGASALAEFGEDSASKIANIADQFGDTPDMIARMNKALRQLADIQDDLERRKPPNLDQYLDQLREAREIVSNSLGTAFARIVSQDADRARIADLVAAGREREGRILERLIGLGDIDVRGRIEGLRKQVEIDEQVLATAAATAKERAKATGSLAASRAELEKLVPLGEQQARWAARTVDSDAQREEIAKRTGAALQRNLGFVNDTYAGIERLLSGDGSGFFESLQQSFRQLQGARLADSIFGDAFAELERFTKRNSPESIATRHFVTQIDTAGAAAKGFSEALVKATNAIAPANDNEASETNPYGLIKVEGSRSRLSVDLSSSSQAAFMSKWANSVVRPMIDELNTIFGTRFFANFSGVLAGALEGYVRAGSVGAGIGGVKGIVDGLAADRQERGKSTEALSNISSKLGNALQGAEMGDQTARLLRSIGIKTSRTGGAIGGAVGSFLPIPGGQLIGSVIGSVVGGLFKKTPRGAVLLGGPDQMTTTGNKAIQQRLSGTGQNVQDSLSRIAAALGGEVGGYRVSIGEYKGYYRVSGSGSGSVGDKKYPKRAGSDLLYDGQDEGEAIRAAILNAIQDGAIKGIRQGTQRLLQMGKDVDAQLDKAVRFQSIFDRLKEAEDPAAFALEKLNREFASLKSIAEEAGEGLVELEKLYGIERAKIIEETTERLSGSLKALIEDLKTGDNGLGLRARLANARAIFDPLAATIRGGGTVDADKFAEIARTVLDIQRQIDGSQSGYFAMFNDILGLSETALARQRALIEAAAGTGSPFTSPTPSNDNVMGAINGQTTALSQLLSSQTAVLNAINQNIANLGYYGSFGGGGGGRLELAANYY